MTDSPKKHRVLVIGVGSIGERHLRCFQSTGRADMVICEPNDKLRGDIAERYNVAETYADFDAAVRVGCDAAVICTPAPLHIPMAAKLAAARTHLLIEKPLSISLDGIGQMRQIVEQAGVKTMMAYVWRAHPLLAEMKRMLDEGTFGSPRHIVISSGQNFPTWRPAYRETYYTKHESGGGAIQDALTHMLNVGEWLCGPITRLAADCAHQVLPGVTVEDTVNLIARQGDGVLASYSLNQFQAGNVLSFSVKCDKGMIEMEVATMRLRWMREPETPWQEMTLDKLERDTMFITQATRFLDVIEGKAEPLCTLDEGIQTLKVNLAALQAAKSAEWRGIS